MCVKVRFGELPRERQQREQQARTTTRRPRQQQQHTARKHHAAVDAVVARSTHPGAAKLLRGLRVRRDDHDVVSRLPQALDQALEPVLHAADVAEGAGLHEDGDLALVLVVVKQHRTIVATSTGQRPRDRQGRVAGALEALRAPPSLLGDRAGRLQRAIGGPAARRAAPRCCWMLQQHRLDPRVYSS